MLPLLFTGQALLGKLVLNCFLSLMSVYFVAWWRFTTCCKFNLLNTSPETSIISSLALLVCLHFLHVHIPSVKPCGFEFYLYSTQSSSLLLYNGANWCDQRTNTARCRTYIPCDGMVKNREGHATGNCYLLLTFWPIISELISNYLADGGQ